MPSHITRRFDPSKFEALSVDLLLGWEDQYGFDKFPPASNFLGKIDKSKNRHILHSQIHEVPLIQKLVLALEDEHQ